MQEIKNISINETGTFFCCCMSTDISIYSVQPAAKIYTITNTQLGGVPVMARLLDSSNLMVAIIAIPGNLKKLILYDLSRHVNVDIIQPITGKDDTDIFAKKSIPDHINPLLADIRHEPNILRNVFITKTYFIISFTRKIIVFNYTEYAADTHLPMMERFDKHSKFVIITPYNTYGLCSFHENTLKVAFPSIRVGSIEIRRLISNPKQSASPKIISAFSEAVNILVFSNKGDMICVTSILGNIIRIFNAVNESTTHTHEFRRGIDHATMHSLRFFKHDTYIICSSDKGTVHIFSVTEASLNKKSIINSIGFLSPYLNSLYGMTKFPLYTEQISAVSFTNCGNLLAVSSDGFIHLYSFNACKANYLDCTQFTRLKL
ncbi:hypothetical protein A3Q56_06046 [Intoshia linei]|uniref:WD repeat domain phosphoinositide-interacting protein 2 n=1 Tax=Intoshia linei TaxID=1819745 RepID=A0A177AXX7_9BILA|nr:hypothetical protein A3Q56_06046 [Intoshia linei]